MNPEFASHLITFLMAAVLVFGVYHGYRGGLIRTAFKVAGLVAGVVFARPIAEWLGPFLEDRFDLGLPWFLLVFASFLITAVVFALLGALLATMVSWTPLIWLDRLGGAALGLAIGLLVAGLLLSFFGNSDSFARIVDAAVGWEEKLLEVLMKVTPDLFREGKDLLDPIREHLPEELTA